MTEPDVIELAKQLRYDLTAMQAKLSTLLTMLAALNLQPSTRPACPTCGLTFRSDTRLDEHRYHAHNGPVPAGWQHAEQLEEGAPV